MKKMGLAFLLFPLFSLSQKVNIIPQPEKIEIKKGSYLIKNGIQVVYDDNTENSAIFLQDYLQEYYHIKANPIYFETKKRNPTLIFFFYATGNPPGSYTLEVNSKGITIAGDSTGIFYGVQTLIQLLPVKPATALQIPFVKIEDEPKFAYRGMHLDVGRHFFPVSFVKKYIDYLALHKMNYFHWHLTEDQGWRIEIKKYPELTKTGGWRNGTIIGRYPGTGSDNEAYGGFYTQDEIRDVVDYASKRYITVVPEIEMPGHSSAAIAAYPYLSCFPNEPTKIPANMISKASVDQQANGRIKLVQETWGVFDDVYCAGKDSVFQFLQDVMDEVLELFPSKYIHVGGDESPKTNWKRCPLCQKRIADEHLKDEHELQSYFIQRIEKYLNGKGRTLIGWDEILEGGLAPNAVVMSWRGEEGGIAAARQNHNVIMTPGGWLYFDHSQSQKEDSVTIGGYVPLEKTYSYNPVPDSLSAEQAKYIMGAQANLWTEYIQNTRKIEYMIFPRMSALSEVDWSKKQDWKDFETRLLTQFKRYDLWKANYSRAYFDLQSSVSPTEDFNGLYLKLETKKPGDTIMVNTVLPVGKLFKYTKPLKITQPTILSAYLKSAGNKTVGYSQYFRFNKATGKKITITNQPAKNYPGDGAFTLVDGIQNEKGLARTKEILGFSGTDCEAIIDLGKPKSISSFKVHIFVQVPSWIWRPQYAEIFSSNDGVNFTSLAMSDDVEKTQGNAIIGKEFPAVTTRYIKVVVKNWGTIADGNPGAGNKAWLFVDEIEID